MRELSFRIIVDDETGSKEVEDALMKVRGVLGTAPLQADGYGNLLPVMQSAKYRTQNMTEILRRLRTGE